MRLTKAVPLLKPLTLPLTFALTSLTFTLTLHPELLHRVQWLKKSIGWAADSVCTWPYWKRLFFAGSALLFHRGS